MVDIIVDSRTFHFPDDWRVMKYDNAPYYHNHLKNEHGWRRGLKAVDLIAYDPSGRILYLIESKDYRANPRKKNISPEKEFFNKVLDTLTGLVPTALCSTTETAGEDKLRYGLRRAKKLRLIYQFEQPEKHSKLFPRAYDPVDMQQKLQQELRCFDPHTLVIERQTQHKVRWTVS